MSTNSVTGPVELAIIEFPGSHFKGEIVPKMSDLVERGIVAILDLVFITKDNDGLVTAIELDNLDEEDAAPFRNLDGEVNGLLSDDDLQAAGAALSPGSSAAMIVWENTWARDLVGAIRRAGGRLVAHDRLDAETVQEALTGNAAS
jgi:uncharacterized membrane protein